MDLLLEHLWRFLRHAGQVLQRLWHEVTGAVFLGLAVFGGMATWREWRAYQRGEPPWEFLLALAFVIMMGSFGVYSFLRARRIR